MVISREKGAPDYCSLQLMDHTMAGIEDIVGQHGNYHVRDK